MNDLMVMTGNTMLIPFLTALAKKVFRTEKMSEQTRKTFHTFMPLVAGILTNGLYEYQRSQDWKLALAIGLGSGGAASSFRDVDKNMNLLGSMRNVLKEPENTQPK